MEARPLLASQQQTKQKKHNHHSAPWSPRKLQQKRNTYNSGYSLVVTHLTTNPPVRCLNRAERTGSLVFNVLWSYVESKLLFVIYIPVTSLPNRTPDPRTAPLLYIFHILAEKKVITVDIAGHLNPLWPPIVMNEPSNRIQNTFWNVDASVWYSDDQPLAKVTCRRFHDGSNEAFASSVLAASHGIRSRLEDGEPGSRHSLELSGTSKL